MVYDYSRDEAYYTDSENDFIEYMRDDYDWTDEIADVKSILIKEFGRNDWDCYGVEVTSPSLAIISLYTYNNDEISVDCHMDIYQGIDTIKIELNKIVRS